MNAPLIAFAVVLVVLILIVLSMTVSHVRWVRRHGGFYALDVALLLVEASYIVTFCYTLAKTISSIFQGGCL